MTKKILIIIAIIIGVGAVFYGGWFAKGLVQNQQNAAAEKPANQLVDAIVAGNSGNQYDKLNNTYKQIMNKQQFNDLVGWLKGYTVATNTTYISDNAALTMVELEYSKDATKTSATMSIMTVKDGKEWKILRVVPSKS